MVVIKRDSGWVDRFRSYQVVLDGEVIGEINNGEEKKFQIQKGAYELKLVIDWCNSNSLNINHTDDVPLKLECGSNLRGLKAFLTTFYIFKRPDKYLWLSQSN